MNFLTQLDEAIEQNNSLVCVGLDSELALVKDLVDSPTPLYDFNRSIVDDTHDLVCAYKPNLAFYEVLGAGGITQLIQTISYIHTVCKVPVIVDAKRSDIGNTSRQYVRYVFETLGADAVTVQPYMGRDSVEEFLRYEDKGVLVLCRNSNDGSGEFQDLTVGNGEKLYEYVAEVVSRDWNSRGNCMLVVGATRPDELARVRGIVGDMPILVPGVGVQGGDLEKTLEAGLTKDMKGLVINSSRGIIFAEDGARSAAGTLRDTINRHRGS